MPDTLTLRRVYTRPVTFADLKRAYGQAHACVVGITSAIPEVWHDCLKLATGATDEIVTTINGREVRQCTVGMGTGRYAWPVADPDKLPTVPISGIDTLLDLACTLDYWHNPRPITINI